MGKFAAYMRGDQFDRNRVVRPGHNLQRKTQRLVRSSWGGTKTDVTDDIGVLSARANEVVV